MTVKWPTTAPAVAVFGLLYLISAVGGDAAEPGSPDGAAPAENLSEWSVTAEPLSPHVKIGHRTVGEWREAIDAEWGPGMSAAEQLAIFDAAWQAIDRGYGAFVNFRVDMGALRDRWRPEIEEGVSKGRFAAIMNHLSFAMRDAHTTIMRRSVNWSTTIRKGTPMLIIGGWEDNARFGASLTPMADGSLLVFRTAIDHPLGLEPGDLVIGYDGVPWRELYRRLLAAELPIQQRSSWGSTSESMRHALLISAGLNWHLFDTIEIQKYGSDDVMSYPTSLLANQFQRVWGNEQLPVAGVAMPHFPSRDYISWGVVEDTQIGYIYVASWHWEDEYRISEQWYEAVDELMNHHETVGLIIDFRLNYGGSMLEAHDGYSLLFNERIRNFSFDVRGSPNDHLDMVPHPTFNSWLFTIPGDPSTYYNKPIAVLIGPGAVSNGDWESLRMGYHPMALRIGKPTNGAFTSSDFPDLGDDWFFTRATGSGYLVDGHRYLAHTGVRPEVEIWLDRDDVAEGRDTVVEAAIRWIGGRTPRRATGRLSP